MVGMTAWVIARNIVHTVYFVAQFHLGTVQYLLKGRAGGKQGRASTFFSRLKGRAFTFLCNN